MKPLHFFALALTTAALAGCQPSTPATPEVATPQPAPTPEAAVPAKPSDTAAAKPYPLETCLGSNEKLGSMGEPVVKVYNGQEFKFCCDHCVEDFEKEPDAYLTKLEAKLKEKAATN